MRTKDIFIKYVRLLSVAALCIALAPTNLFSTPASIDITDHHKLDNGMDVRLLPQRGSGLVSTLVLVRTGYANEQFKNSGYSHLLEHLVFSGTESRTREEISREIKELGGYINGFTRDEYTGYLVVVHADHMEKGLDVLADMLFSSTIKEETVSEAREVVLEEMRRRESRPDTVEADKFNELLYGDSPYSWSGLGNEKAVSSVSRQEILSYYQEQYVPENMIVLMNGDFNSAKALETVKSIFGGIGPGGGFRGFMAPQDITGSRIYLLRSRMPDSRIRIGFNGPLPRKQEVEAIELLGRVLEGDSGILNRSLKSAGINAKSVSAGLVPGTGFSRFIITVVLSGTPGATGIHVDPHGALEVILEALTSMVSSELPVSLVNESRESLVSGEIMGKEQLHYFLMSKAPWEVAGVAGQSFSHGRWDHLLPEDLIDATADYLVNRPYVALLTMPAEAREDLDEPVIVVPRASAQLDNGLTVTVEQRPGSEVFAVHLMTRQRSAMEPEGKKGIADFLHRLLPMGTFERTREQIAEEIRRQGVSLSVAGDPMSPFGDFYTSTLYSYVRMTCVQDKAKSSLDLLSDMVKNPLLPTEEVEEVRGRVLDILNYRSKSPGNVARNMMAEPVYGGILPGSVYGTNSSIESISTENLKTFHEAYFTGRNLIITVVSGLPPSDVLAMVEARFSDLPAGSIPEEVSLPITGSSVVLKEEMGKAQGALAFGSVTSRMEKADDGTLSIVTGLLNQTLYEKLREKEGLAYSLGAGVGVVEGMAVFTMQMGTSPDKLYEARSRVIEEIAAARAMKVTYEDLKREVNARLGKVQRRMMSSINRTFYLGLADRNGLNHAFGEDYRQMLLSLTPEDVEKAARKYLPGANLVEVIVK